MLLFGGGLGIVLLALWIFCIVDVIVTDEGDVRHLPKMAWLLIVLVLPDIGSIIWLVAGRPVTVQNSFSTKAERASSVTDQRHRFALSWVAEPRPFHRGHEMLGKFFNDWKLSGVVTTGSGRPIDARISGDANQVGIARMIACRVKDAMPSLAPTTPPLTCDLAIA